jgi:hypothetical protein
MEQWAIGLTQVGVNYGIGFNLDQNGRLEHSSPSIFWQNPQTGEYVLIRSIDSINQVIEANFGMIAPQDRWAPYQKHQPATARELYFEAQMAVIRGCVQEHVVTAGPTGLSLAYDDEEYLKLTIDRLRQFGLDPKATALLLKLGGPMAIKSDLKMREWSAVWCQITSSGAIERVMLHGTLPKEGSSPPGAIKLRSVLHEEIYDAGTVSPDILRSDKIADPTLVR